MSSPHDCPRPTDPYMNPAQLDFFRARLLRWRRELSQQLAPHSRPTQEEVRQPDWVDSAALKIQNEITWVGRERALRIIREIDEALERIQEGSYGYCQVSGEEIGLKRLSILPTARFSVITQEQLEHGGHHR